MNFRLFTCGLLLALVSGCASVNVRTDHQAENMTPPSFEKTYTFWWWGLKGEYLVNAREVCLGKGVEQMQAVNTFEDTAISILTLGIYTKRTARVWCKGQGVAHD